MSLKKNYADVQKFLDLNVERSRVQVNTQESMLKDYKLNTEVSGQVIKGLQKAR